MRPGPKPRAFGPDALQRFLELSARTHHGTVQPDLGVTCGRYSVTVLACGPLPYAVRERDSGRVVATMVSPGDAIEYAAMLDERTFAPPELESLLRSRAPA